MNRVRATNARGFTLLEAIVAMVVFTLGSLALYGWLGTSLAAIDRIAAVRQEAEAAASALDLVRRVNPMAEPAGTLSLDELQVDWRATPMGPPRPAVTQIGAPGLFEVGLFLVSVQVSHGGRQVADFQVRQAGYRQVRPLEVE